MFGQAQGGGIVSAADQYGFIIVAPSSGRCWDVQSNKTWTRDGGGDSHAIRQMVRYAVDNRNGNPDRVYATGDSSGGMMTELLLALYPDVFKGGAAFAGMPAACRGTNESGSGGGYSGACAGGSVTHTAQQWGDIARMLAPGYAGHRPRVQLFHGDADTTIRYANHTEAIKEWTNVLGLSTAPTTTDTGVQLGNHQATRQRWQNACGQVVLDAFTSIGGDHGPSDALFKSQFVIPFLGLDKTGAVDPEVQQCGAGGAGGGGAAARAAAPVARAAAPALEPGALREEVVRVEPSAEAATAAVVPAGAAAMAAPPATAGPAAPLARRDKGALREAAATAVAATGGSAGGAGGGSGPGGASGGTGGRKRRHRRRAEQRRCRWQRAGRRRFWIQRVQLRARQFEFRPTCRHFRSRAGVGARGLGPGARRRTARCSSVRSRSSKGPAVFSSQERLVGSSNTDTTRARRADHVFCSLRRARHRRRRRLYAGGRAG